MFLGFTSHRKGEETPSQHFFSSFSMGNFTERISLSMPFSHNAILPLGVFLKLIHYDSRKTEKLFRSHEQHPVTAEHTCVFHVIQICFVRDSVTLLLCLCETSFQIQTRHEVSNPTKLERGHCRKKRIFIESIFYHISKSVCMHSKNNSDMQKFPNLLKCK